MAAKTLMQRWRVAKGRHPDCVILMQTSRGYRLFQEDFYTGLTAAPRSGRVKVRRGLLSLFIKGLGDLESVLQSLVSRGHRVAIRS